MIWGRWVPGKYHALVSPTLAGLIVRYGPGAVETACGRYMREPDLVTERPLTACCAICLRATVKAGVAV